IANFWCVVGTLGNSIVRKGACGRKTANLQTKICFEEKAGHFLKKNAPPKLIQFLSPDRGRHDLFCTSLCACRCLGASDRGPDRGHGPSDGHARNARADLSSSHRSSGPLHTVERPRPRQHMADASSSLGASNNDPPPDTSSRRSTRTRYLPVRGMAGERRSLGVEAVRRSEFQSIPG